VQGTERGSRNQFLEKAQAKGAFTLWQKTENQKPIGSVPFDHVAIDHSQLYRPVPRVTSND